MLSKLAHGRLGEFLRPAALDDGEVQRLAEALGLRLPARAAQRLPSHTGGIPLHARALLEELPAESWHDPEADLPAPRPYAAIVVRRLPPARTRRAGSSKPSRSSARRRSPRRPSSPQPPILAAAALHRPRRPGHRGRGAVRRARRGRQRRSAALGRPRRPALSHPLTAASVLAAARRGPPRTCPPRRRGAGHRRRDRAPAPGGRRGRPDADLAADFEAFAGREAARRQAAATALITASRLSVTPASRDARLLRAVDWMLLAGDLALARTYAAEVAATAPGPRRDSTLAGFALTSGDVEGAAPLLASAWQGCDPGVDPELAALIAHRNAFHALVNLRDDAVVEWTARAAALSPDAVFGVEWIAMQALALWRLGRRGEAYALLEASMGAGGDAVAQLRGKRGWLRCADDDLGRGRADLEAAAEAELRLGALSIGAIHLTTLARAHYAAGAWEDAVVAAERAVAISSELEHAPGRAFVWWGAVAVPAARGDWAAADAYAAQGAAVPIDAPDRVVAAGMAQALPAAARGDSAAVIRVLEPVARLSGLSEGAPSGVDAPGFWPWQDLYAEALVGVGRVDDADAFLAPHEALAAGHASMSARLARVRGRVEAARGNKDAATAAFERALERIGPLGMPYERALIELAHGQFLRRAGRRRAAAQQLTAARDTLAALGARPALERAERELGACGLKPLRRSAREQPGLTPQEQAVARLVAMGRTNRQVADELLLSTKTVEVHLTRIYAKLGITSRSQLAARRENP